MSTESMTDEHHGLHPTASQVYSMSKLGMWVFLITEILLFSGLFVTYAVYRYRYPDMFHEAHHFLSVPFGAANTVILLASSFTVAWAVDAIKRNKRQLTNWLIVITIGLAAGFMANKAMEYTHKTHPEEIKKENLAPAYAAALEEAGKCENGKCIAVPFQPWNMGAKNAKTPVFANTFFAQYFIMTGIHGLHVLIGMGIFIWVLSLGLRDKLSPEWMTPVEVSGLYWHLVDLIWIYLFPMLYLVS